MEAEGILPDWPFPQLFRGENTTLLATATKLYTIDEDAELSSPEPVSDVTLHPSIVLRGPKWYEDKRAAGKFGTASYTKYFAPLAVFLDGTDTWPRTEVVDYEWRVDGVFVAEGFTYGHVLEDVGVHTIRLTVTNKAGSSFFVETTVEVLARTGTTYYVDSAIGNDSNDGLTTGTAWKTATKAFSGILTTFYDEGDQVLFNRGQTFDITCNVVKTKHFLSGFGYMFGAYGVGADPIIKNAAPSNEGVMLKFQGLHAAHIVFRDLEFNGTEPGGERCIVVEMPVSNCHFLFLDCTFKQTKQVFDFTGNPPNNEVSDIFVHNCVMDDSRYVQNHFKCRRCSISGNLMEDSGNHIIYIGWGQKFSIRDNEVNRPSFGRTCLRISGGSDNFAIPATDFWVDGNTFRGHIDSSAIALAEGSNGTRYNFRLCTIAPQGRTDQSIENVVWRDNIVEDYEGALQIGAAENVEIYGNSFTSPSSYANAPTIHFGTPFDRRPCKNVKIHDNTLMVTSDSTKNPAFKIDKYPGQPFNGSSIHQNIQIYDNEISFASTIGYAYAFEDASGFVHQQFHLRNDWVGVNRATDKVFFIGASFTNPVFLYTLDEWYELYGEEPLVVPTDPLTGWALTELVTYALPTLDNETITNGAIASAGANWTLEGSRWTKTTGALVCVSGADSDRAKQLNADQVAGEALVIGQRYRVTYTVALTSGAVRVQVGSTGYGVWRRASGTYTEEVVCVGDSVFYFEPSTTASSLGPFAGSVDNVSVKRVVFTPKAITEGGSWHFADMHDSWLMFNGACQVWKFGGASLAYCDDSRTIQSGDYSRGRIMIAGFDPTDFFSADWQAQYTSWAANSPVPVPTIEMPTNFTAWSSIGGGDWLFMFDKNYGIVGPIGGQAHSTESSLMLDFLRRNESGFAPVQYQGSPYRVKSLGEGYVVYGDDGITILRRYSEPVPTFGIITTYNFGIATRSAVGGDDSQHLFVDKKGSLWAISSDFKLQLLGYREFFSPLLDSELLISLDGQAREWYISGLDADQEWVGYHLSSIGGLCKIHKAPTSVATAREGLVGYCVDNGDRRFYLKTDSINFGTDNLKTLFQIGLVLQQDNAVSLKAWVEANVAHGNNWRTHGPVLFDRLGRAIFYVPGLEFRIILEGNEYSGLRIDDIFLEYSDTGKRNLISMVTG